MKPTLSDIFNDSASHLKGYKWKGLITFFILIILTGVLTTILTHYIFEIKSIQYTYQPGSGAHGFVEMLTLNTYSYWAHAVSIKWLNSAIFALIIGPLIAGFWRIAVAQARYKQTQALDLFNTYRLDTLWRLASVNLIVVMILSACAALLDPWFISLSLAGYAWLPVLLHLIIAPFVSVFVVFSLLSALQYHHLNKPFLLGIPHAVKCIAKNFILIWFAYVFAGILCILGIVTVIGWIWAFPFLFLIIANLFRRCISLNPEDQQPLNNTTTEETSESNETEL